MTEQSRIAKEITGDPFGSGEHSSPGASAQSSGREPYQSKPPVDLYSGTIATAPAPAGDPMIGQLIDGRYRVEAVLGEGGMGVVYRCRHQIIDKLVAMKVLRADLARDEEVTTRFLNEAKAASAIGNPHIIDISDFGRLPDGSTYFIMEYLYGQPLAALTEKGEPVPVKRILRIALQLGEGLEEAHRAGIVHRDLKPDNIFLISRGAEKDFIKILDFGIAKVSTAGQTSKLTRAGAVFGTPHYMSPEQAAGAPVDLRGDIYSLGVILYELASGRVPFDADNFMGILTQHMYKAPVPIRALVPEPRDVPPGLEAIVLKCLSKRADHRYASMDELVEDLKKLEAGLVPDAVSELMQRSAGFNVPADYMKSGGGMPELVPATPGYRRSRWPIYAGIAGVGVAVAVVIGVFAMSSRTTAAPTEAKAPHSAMQDVPTAPPVATAPLMNAQPEPVAVKSKTVVVGIDPANAHAFLGERDLGKSPVLVSVKEGEEVQIVVRLNGYQEQSLSLDGSTETERVALRPVFQARSPSRPQPPAARTGANPPPPQRPPATTAQPRPPTVSGDGLVDPWR